MGSTLVLDECPSHGERWTGSSPSTRDLGRGSDFDEVGLGVGVHIVYATSLCLARHGVIAQLSGLHLIGDG
jgi:hypothetical protein